MDEAELSKLLQEFIESGDVDTDELFIWKSNHVETGTSGFYCYIDGKAFKIRVTECGKDV